MEAPPLRIVQLLRPQLVEFVSRFNRAAAALAGVPDLELESWYRDSATNARVGGASTSQHLLGLAVDIGGTPGYPISRQARIWVADAMRAVGLVPVDEGNHVHVQAYVRGTLPGWLFRDL